MRITESIGNMFARMRPAPKMPAARRRGEKSEVLGASGAGIENSKLQEERDRLAREFVVLQWDLGGLTYEMARRDHFRLDVLAKSAAKLQQVDSSLGQAERMLRLESEGVAGVCSSCGAMQARGAAFCWQCGTELVASAPVTGQVQPVADAAPSTAPPPTGTAPTTTTTAPAPAAPAPAPPAPAAPAPAASDQPATGEPIA